MPSNTANPIINHNYFISIYNTTYEDVESWQQNFNAFPNHISPLLYLFENGQSELCFDSKECLYGAQFIQTIHSFSKILDDFVFAIDTNSVVYDDGYWFAKATWIMKSRTECTFIDYNTSIHVYYDKLGCMIKTQIIASDNLLTYFRIFGVNVFVPKFQCQHAHSMTNAETVIFNALTLAKQNTEIHESLTDNNLDQVDCFLARSFVILLLIFFM